MTTFNLTIEMDNAAFDDGHGGAVELAYVLRRLAERLDRPDAVTRTIQDTNGSTVGTWKITDDEEPHAYTLAEIRNGTGWPTGVKFVVQ